jgi:phospholipid-binding lipoprotein MlaA
MVLGCLFLCFGFVSIACAADATIEIEKIAQVSSTSSPQSYLDWRDVDWKDPFVKNGELKVHTGSKAPTNFGVSATIYQVAKSDSTMKLELRMPSSTTIMPSDSFDDLKDPFASRSSTIEMSDPFEDYNRFMFDFNEGFYDNLMEPVVREYRDFVNEDIRIGIANIFDNAMAPLKLVSSFLQGDFDKTGRVLGRTLINTTIGLGGMFDVADRAFDIKDVNEDLDQALGSWGIPTGPYVVLPLFGPSSVRNIIGRAGGIFLSPTYHFAPGVEVGGPLTVTDQINDTSFIVDDIKQLDDSSIDKYESVRDFYGQYRDGLLNE